MSRVLLLAFLAGTTAATSAHAAQRGEIRLTQAEIAAQHPASGGPGTSGVAGIQTVVLAGDPTAAGPYTIELRVPANTKIAAHTHRDDRTAVVVSGTWHFGYGAVATAAATKALGPGSFYSEPGGDAHFAMTGAEPVTVIISGYGPTDTIFTAAAHSQQTEKQP
ncbi:putative RmlC-like cupin family protein [Novosphingobium sp. PhB165]|uniref:cupin domain-containing protein n=1 Tax=Novosphingobium sp. PhB165 TaxID=2485105 RepID=UPI00104E22A6|nr:cupin domain-containing protein [Novosphingobium sp. PhB165]TCM14169.1 putative RmlC-like cupin family protein [Novosphingobium sp. PhB165]